MKGSRSSSKVMRRFPGGGRSIKRTIRKKTATVVEHKKGPKGGETKYRFPMPDKAHARNALARLPQAKGLSSEAKKKIRARAYKMLYGTSDPKKVARVQARRRAKRKVRYQG